jgi:sulfite reductase (NADPH) flavoprotein alpha-component
MTTANNTQNIPFNEAQQAWLGGFFAGMHSHILQSAGSGDAANARTITILYGSQTGNSESVANDAAQAAKAHGLNAKVLGMDEIERDAFIGLEYLLIITSTYGEGDMPDNAQMLWEAISHGLLLKRSLFSRIRIKGYQLNTGHIKNCRA